MAPKCIVLLFITDYFIGIKFINKFLKSEAFAKEKKFTDDIFVFLVVVLVYACW